MIKTFQPVLYKVRLPNGRIAWRHAEYIIEISFVSDWQLGLNASSSFYTNCGW